MRFLISTPPELHQQLKEAAEANGQTLTGFVRQILWSWADQRKEVTTNERDTGLSPAAGTVD